MVTGTQASGRRAAPSCSPRRPKDAWRSEAEREARVRVTVSDCVASVGRDSATLFKWCYARIVIQYMGVIYLAEGKMETSKI